MILLKPLKSFVGEFKECGSTSGAEQKFLCPNPNQHRLGGESAEDSCVKGFVEAPRKRKACPIEVALPWVRGPRASRRKAVPRDIFMT